MGPDAFRVASNRIDEAAVAAGREPAAIRRIYNVDGAITDGAVGEKPLVGPVELWVDTLARWIEQIGVDTIVFWPSDSETIEVERFAAEVVPAVRRAVGA
jgi:hypothetical protein